MTPVNITSENFDSFLRSDRTILLDFYADWCAPCRALSPVVEEFSRENPEIPVGKINVDMQQDLATRYGVMSIPTLIVLRSSKIAARATGVRSKEQIREMIQ